jgi:hypothetical protein
MSARRLLTACLTTALLFAPVSHASPQDGAAKAEASSTPVAITLKPAFKKGDTHKFTWHIERSSTFDAMQQTGTDTSIIDAGITLQVAESTEAGHALDVTIDSIKVDHQAAEIKLAWDSSQPEDDKDRDNEAFLAFKPLIGMKLTLNTDKNGVITSVSGEPATPQGRRLVDVARQFFITPEYLMFRWNTILNARRDGGEIKPGETWSQTDTFVAPQVGRFEHILTHSLKSVTDGTAVIDTIGQMNISPAKEGAPMAFELKDTNILATSQWSLADGMSRSLEMQRSFTLDGSAQGMPVKRKVDEKITITRVQ